jgi:hypothetical protein
VPTTLFSKVLPLIREIRVQAERREEYALWYAWELGRGQKKMSKYAFPTLKRIKTVHAYKEESRSRNPGNPIIRQIQVQTKNVQTCVL